MSLDLLLAPFGYMALWLRDRVPRSRRAIIRDMIASDQATTGADRLP